MISEQRNGYSITITGNMNGVLFGLDYKLVAPDGEVIISGLTDLMTTPDQIKLRNMLVCEADKHRLSKEPQGE